MEVLNLEKTVPLADGGTLTILQEINFAVGAGETVAIVGASGSGKSTLLGLMAGLDVPSMGTVKLRGTDLFSLDEDDRARVRGETIGFVFQSFQLLPALTALENVMMPLELAGRSKVRDTARQWLARVGLEGRLGHYPKHLFWRRATARGPGACLCHAAGFAAGRRTNRESGCCHRHHIIDLIFELNRESGTTLMLVTHDEELAAACGRSLRLKSGRMVE